MNAALNFSSRAWLDPQLALRTKDNTYNASVLSIPQLRYNLPTYMK